MSTKKLNKSDTAELSALLRQKQDDYALESGLDCRLAEASTKKACVAMRNCFGDLKDGKLTLSYERFCELRATWKEGYIGTSEAAKLLDAANTAFARCIKEAYDATVKAVAPTSPSDTATDKKAQRTATAEKIQAKVTELGTAEEAAKVVEKLAKVAIDKMTAVVKAPGKDVKQAEAAAKLAEQELTLARKAHDKLVEVNQVKNLEAIKAYAATIADNMKAAKKAGNVDYFRKLAAISC